MQIARQPGLYDGDVRARVEINSIFHLYGISRATRPKSLEILLNGFTSARRGETRELMQNKSVEKCARDPLARESVTSVLILNLFTSDLRFCLSVLDYANQLRDYATEKLHLLNYSIEIKSMRSPATRS